ncbi:MAG: molybdopterin adenylyltransferase [Proteobacteria bacterium]|nr:molybdopterin adenylyltransferase [Pseudomonadota bacterium]MDA0867961.1 molybdopterin adenylyltransferase [Pseudomonadota bacterium]
MDELHFGLLSVSDRAAAGTYEDQGLPALQQWLQRAIRNPLRLTTEVIPDERPTIAHALRTMADGGCHVVLTTGGTGPAPRDVTPEATMDVSDRVLPGFGEQMRQIGLQFVPTAILSRQVAVMRGKCLIINLPGQPKSIAETLEGVRDADGQIKVPGIFTAVPYCVDLMGGPYIETNAAVCDAFRPKSARRPSGG